MAVAYQVASKDNQGQKQATRSLGQAVIELAPLRATAAISSILTLLLCLSSVCFPVRCQTPETTQSLSTEPAVLSGKVRDLHGTPVPSVQVTLVRQGEPVNPVTTTDAEGAFVFPQVAPGTYRVKINAPGSAPRTSDEIVLGPGERRDFPISTMGRPSTRTTVQVKATLNEVAQAQVEEQEKQRMLGFVPNYYTSYIWDATPMTPKLKFGLAFRSALDPFNFLVSAGIAGAEQSHNTFPGYGQGAQGYAKRFAASYADTVAHRMLSSAIFPAVLHQDPRYFYHGSGSVRSRAAYAVMSTIITRGDNGRRQLNYSQLLGNFAAAGLSNVYRAPGDRQASLTLRNGLIITGSAAVTNVLREFLSRKLTRNLPAHATGKP